MSNFEKFKTLCFFYAASFAVVLEAVPQYYPGIRYDEQYHHHHHHPLQPRIPRDYRSQEYSRRFIREPDFDGYKIGDRLTDEKFYEPIYDNRRRTRSDVASRSNSVFVEVKPDGEDFYGNIKTDPDTIYSKSQTANKLYVVRPADPINRNNDYTEGNLSIDKKSAQKFNPFPISMMRRDSTLVNTARSFTDEELGKIVRKAIITAGYGDSEKADQPTKRFSHSIVRKPLEESELQVYRPRISSINYPTEFVPEMNMADITPAGEEDEPEDRLSTDFKIEKGFSLDNDEVSTIGEETPTDNVEVHPNHAADVALSETEPEVYQFVDDVERSPEELSADNYEEEVEKIDEPIQGDVVLSVIEEDLDDPKNFEDKVKDGEEQRTVDDHGTENLTTFTTEAQSLTTDNNYDIEKDSNPVADVTDERPPTYTTEASLADESITDPSTTTVE